MVSSNERQSKIRRRLCWPQCGSLDNILGLLFSGSLGNSVQQCSSPFCRVAFGTRNALLRYGICVPCSKRLPGVRDAFSEAFGVKNRLLGYGRDIRCAKQAPMVRLASRNDPSGEGTQNGTQNGIQKAIQNGTRKATQNGIFIYEIKDLS